MALKMPARGHACVDRWQGRTLAVLHSQLAAVDPDESIAEAIPKPLRATKATSELSITNSFISNGDDQVAISSNAVRNPVTNVSVTNIHTSSGRGISIGSGTKGGIGDVLVDTIDQAGNAADPDSNGFRIKSAADRGGLVQNVTFRNVCQRDETCAVRFYPFYTTPANTDYIPTFSNIAVRNVTILANPSGGAGSFTFQGYDANHITSLTLDNLNVLGTPDVTFHAPANVAITLGPGPVNPVSRQHLTGAGVTYTGSSITNPSETPYPCGAADFPPLAGELFVSTNSATNLLILSTAYPATFTLNAVVKATAAEYAAPNLSHYVLRGIDRDWYPTLGGNGTLVSLASHWSLRRNPHVYRPISRRQQSPRARLWLCHSQDKRCFHIAGY
jgi:hypothetical protein